MNKLQKHIRDQKRKHGVAYSHLHKTAFNFMSRQTFHKMKETGDISRMSLDKCLQVSGAVGMSIEEMMEEVTNEV